MRVTRRDFLKGAGAASATLAATGSAAAQEPAGLKTTKLPSKIEGAEVTTTICPYCAVGCGLLVHTRDGKVVNIEGDPDHPINEGTLCSKGQSLFQVVMEDSEHINRRRLQKVLHRKPGATQWQQISWDEAIPRMAKLIKKARDDSFQVKENGKLVNRTNGLACLGGASLDSEECYLYSKFARALGVTWLEHQARI